MQYTRLENETEDQLILRVCSDKDIIGTWNDVADILNTLLEVNHSESTYRKKYKALNISSDDIQKQIIDLKKEKQKLADERSQFNQLIRTQARKESFEDVIKKVISENVAPIELSVNDKYDEEAEDVSLLIHLTDIHAGIEIDDYLNTFNEEVLAERIEDYISQIIAIKKRHHTNSCHIVIGEILSGLIHNNLRLQNNLDLVQQFIYVSNLISVMLIKLSVYFNNINIYVTPGNHSRISPKKEDSLDGENMDLLLPFYLKARLQNFTSIKINDNTINQEIAMFNIHGNNIFASHGHKDNPSTVVQNFTMMYGIKPDIVLLGHRHTNALSTVYNTKVIESGCVSGSDNYAIGIRKTNYPEQTVSVIGKEGLLCLYDIKLNH